MTNESAGPATSPSSITVPVANRALTAQYKLTADEPDVPGLGFSDDGKTLVVEAFKSGKHTDASGVTKEWTDLELEQIADKANAQLLTKPVPVVLGHPEDDAPAVGWVESVKAVGSKLVTTLKDLNQAFVDDLKQGAYKTRSISLYPDLRMRHLGFLGAMQPAVEGLEPFSFSTTEDFTSYSFGPDIEDWTRKDVSFLKRLLNRFGYEVKNKEKIMSDTKIETPLVEAAASVAFAEPSKVMPSPAEVKDPGPTATEKIANAEAKAEANAMATENAQLKTEVSVLQARIAVLEAAVKAAAEEEKAEAVEAPAAFCEKLIAAGKLKPADKDITILAMNSMAELDKSLNYSESGKTRTSIYKEHLMAAAPIIKFGETFPSLPASESVSINMSDVIENKMKTMPTTVSYWDNLKQSHAEAAKSYPKEYAEYMKTMLPGK